MLAKDRRLERGEANAAPVSRGGGVGNTYRLKGRTKRQKKAVVEFQKKKRGVKGVVSIKDVDLPQ